MLFVPAESTLDIKPYDRIWKEGCLLRLESELGNQRLYKGNPLNIPDISYFVAGGVIVSPKTVELMGDYLSKFGDLHPITVEGNNWFTYDITNIIDGVVDKENSSYSRRGLLRKPAFNLDKLPKDPQVFKIEDDNRIGIYLNQPTTVSDTLYSLGVKLGLEVGDEPQLIWEN
ncbi:Uncharacterised protein [BD1-7 clade bacterium]|nr:Uncharacterised protein [BD1-7 clade bacterium]